MGSGELQPWNNPPEKDTSQEGKELEEVVPLQNKN
jgi:hypothetical protein